MSKEVEMLNNNLNDVQSELDKTKYEIDEIAVFNTNVLHDSLNQQWVIFEGMCTKPNYK